MSHAYMHSFSLSYAHHRSVVACDDHEIESLGINPAIVRCRAVRIY